MSLKLLVVSLCVGFYDIVKTPKGMSRLSWSKWGNLRMVNNAGLAATVYAKHAKSSTTKTKALQWARSQADYAMGSRQGSQKYCLLENTSRFKDTATFNHTTTNLAPLKNHIPTF